MKWLAWPLLIALLSLTILPAPTKAATDRSIEDESIFEVEVDRFFNKTSENDFDVNTQDPAAFAGGDFLGLTERLNHIEKMGFTTILLSPVFATETYDGLRTTDYAELDRHFGTPEELKGLIKKAHKSNINIMVDIPLQNVSANHVWLTEHPDWATINGDTLQWDFSNDEVVSAFEEMLTTLTSTYKIDGVRFVSTTDVSTDVLNRLIAAAKSNDHVKYALVNEQTDANVDAAISHEQSQIWQELFKTIDQPSEPFNKIDVSGKSLHFTDSVYEDRRFTADAADENMFPPTRWKLVLAAMMSVPGVPMMQYGSEIAMNGTSLPESHQIMNFKTEDELMDYIGDVQSLRNQSEALRTGKMEILHAEDGFYVYKRWNEDETWLVVINNTGKTQSIDLTKEQLGDNQQLRGLFESDRVNMSDEGTYRVILDRELAEFYTVKDHQGLNKGYIIALSLVYILFVGFIVMVYRKGKQKKKA